jgi:hypothetical protein
MQGGHADMPAFLSVARPLILKTAGRGASLSISLSEAIREWPAVYLALGSQKRGCPTSGKVRDMAF